MAPNQRGNSAFGTFAALLYCVHENRVYASRIGGSRAPYPGLGSSRSVKDAEASTRRYASGTAPGFRPGKAPATVVRKKFGEAIRQEALESPFAKAIRVRGEESIKVRHSPVHDLSSRKVSLLPSSSTRSENYRRARANARIQDPATCAGGNRRPLAQQLEQIRDEKATGRQSTKSPSLGTW